MIQVSFSELESQGPDAHQPDIRVSEIAHREDFSEGPPICT